MHLSSQEYQPRHEENIILHPTALGMVFDQGFGLTVLFLKSRSTGKAE